MLADRRTKIVATIGPATKARENLRKAILAGLNVARLNFSHGTHEEHLKVIALLKKVRTDLKVPLAIMLDTKGPEIRLRKIKDGQVYLPAGHLWKLVPHELEGDANSVTLTPPSILEGLTVGQEILFDDGYVSCKVKELQSDGVVVEISNGGLIRSGKGVNIPDSSSHVSAVTEKDIEDIRFGCEQDVDLIAASFVRSAEDVLVIKKLLDECKKPEILVIAKIENKEGVLNFDSIVQVADGIIKIFFRKIGMRDSAFLS